MFLWCSKIEIHHPHDVINDDGDDNQHVGIIFTQLTL